LSRFSSPLITNHLFHLHSSSILESRVLNCYHKHSKCPAEAQTALCHPLSESTGLVLTALCHPLSWSFGLVLTALCHPCPGVLNLSSLHFATPYPGVLDLSSLHFATPCPGVLDLSSLPIIKQIQTRYRVKLQLNLMDSFQVKCNFLIF